MRKSMEQFKKHSSKINWSWPAAGVFEGLIFCCRIFSNFIVGGMINQFLWFGEGKWQVIIL